MNTDHHCCICLLNEEILINPCKCKGTIFYHELCVIEFILKNELFECPNCKSKYTSVLIDKLQNFVKLNNHYQIQETEIFFILVLITCMYGILDKFCFKSEDLGISEYQNHTLRFLILIIMAVISIILLLIKLINYQLR